MTDEKKCPHCGSDAELATAREPVSRLHSVISSYRHAYHGAQASPDIGDAIIMASVVIGALIVVMFLTIASRDGVSAFISGICVGIVVGVMLWSYGSLWPLRAKRFRPRPIGQCHAHLPDQR